MARSRTKLSLDNAGKILKYLLDASSDESRWASLVAVGRSAAAACALRLISVHPYCPVPQPASESGAVSSTPDLDQLESWLTAYVPASGWSRIQNAMRQQRHAKRLELKTIKVPSPLHDRLVALSRDVTKSDIVCTLEKLTAFAEQHNALF